MGACNSGGNTDEIDLATLNYEQELRHFYVITVIFNPARSKDRIKLYLTFRKRMEQVGVKLVTVECAYDKAPFTVTSANYEPHNIQIRTTSPLFLKECLINRALSVLPSDAKYVCWVDFETEFLNPNWVNDAIKALNTYKAVQLFEDIVWLSASGKEARKEKSFAAQLPTKKGVEKAQFEQTLISAGYAWGYRVEVLKELQGLIDFSIIGNSEKIMAYCLADRADEYVPMDISENYRDTIKNWQKKAAQNFVKGIGTIPGTVNIHFSSTKRDRKSYEKWDILRENMFDPRNDLVKDSQGIYTITPDKPKLLEDMRVFFEEIQGEMQDL